jgi:hypothetical protein
VGFPEPAGQAQARLDERQPGAGLSLAQQDDSTYVQQVGDQVLIANGAGNGQRLPVVVFGDRVAACHLKEVGRCGQRPGARQRRPLGGRHVKQRLQRVGSLGELPTGPPVHAQRGGQPQARLGVGLGQAEGDRGAQVAQLGVEPVQPLDLVVRHQLGGGRLGQGQVVIAVGGPGGASSGRALRVQLPGRVLPDGFQQPVPALAGPGVTELHQALVHQRA